MTEAVDPARLLASLPGALLALGADHAIRFASDGAESFFGRSRARMLGRPVGEVVQFDNDRLNRALIDCDANLSAQDMALRGADGRTILADLTIVPLADEPGWRVVILTRRPAEPEHIGSLSAPGERAALGAPAILGHEIKNPLAGIKGAAQLLARRAGDREKPLIELIVAEVDRIASILDQMQNLGARTPGRIDATNIHAIMNRAIQSVRSANRFMPDLRIDFDPSLPDVLVDADAMMQVLVNLIQNAVDALGDADDARITLCTRFVMGGALRHAEPDGEAGKVVRLPVEVAIIDNGPGVPRDIQADIFAPFVTSKRDGQGLGLAIVRKLMRDMHGRVVYERDEPRGLTQFRLFLPVADGGRA